MRFAAVISDLDGVLVDSTAPTIRAWGAAALITGGSIAGGLIGAAYGRRLPERWLRRIVIVGGTIVAVILLVT